MIKEVTTRKAKELLINMPKKELAEVLGLSRPSDRDWETIYQLL